MLFPRPLPAQPPSSVPFIFFASELARWDMGARAAQRRARTLVWCPCFWLLQQAEAAVVARMCRGGPSLGRHCPAGFTISFLLFQISFFDQSLTFIFLNLKPKSPIFRTEIRFPVSSENGKKYRNFGLSDRNGKPWW